MVALRSRSFSATAILLLLPKFYIEYDTVEPAKAIAGLEGFRHKLEIDLEYVEGKLDAIRHMRAELEEHMRRLTEVLQGLSNKKEAECRALDCLTDDFNQLKADREAQIRREEQERDQMHSQLEAEEKMRLCVKDYKH